MNLPNEPAKMKRQCVAILVMRGQRVLVERIAPALRVVREPGQLPRVVVDTDRTVDNIIGAIERSTEKLSA